MRAGQAFERADQFLLWRVFTPIAHWIDYRFHKNQFDVAVFCLMASCVLIWVGAAASALDGWRAIVPTGINCVVCVLFTRLNLLIIKRMQAASRKIERDPSMVPSEVYWYVIMPGWFRLLGVASGLLFWSLLTTLWGSEHNIVGVASAPWMLIDTSSVYFAGMIPPRRERKKKKERTPMATLLPQPAA